MTKASFMRRLCMTILFFGALYSTVTTLTNISYGEFKQYFLNQVNATKQVSNDQVHPENEDANVIQDLEAMIDLEEYPKKRVIATGYTAGYESTGKDEAHPAYGITYSGVQVKRDLYSTIAADPEVFPIGTILYIPNYGYGVVADTGSAIKGNKIDLYYETVDDVYNEWGKREVDVYIIATGDGTLTEETLLQLNENEALQVFREQLNNRN